MSRTSLLIVTTVPETIRTILRAQPRFLSERFSVTLATSPTEEIQAIREYEGVTVEEVRMTRGIHPLNDLRSVLRMVFVLLRHRPNLLHSYTPKAGLVAMLAGWLCRVPVRIHTFTGLIFPTQVGLRKKLLIFVDRLICACATHVVPEGEGVRTDLMRFQVTKRPLRVIGYGNIAGVETSFFSPKAEGLPAQVSGLRRKLQLSEKVFVFCYVGRLNRDKGIDELAKAFAEMPDNARLLVVGELDPTAPIGRQTLESLRCDSRIHLLGFLQDIRPALGCSDVLVLPSYREGFPNSLLQAGAMGLPAVATDVSGSNEIIEPEVNGWLVPPRDAASLERAMRAALTTPAQTLMEMGARARIRVQERFERQDHWERMLAFYERCAADCCGDGGFRSRGEII